MSQKTKSFKVSDRFQYRYLFALWVIAIFIASSISGNQLNKVPLINIPYFDKIVHFFMYFFMEFILLHAYNRKYFHKFNYVNILIITSTLSVTYGVFMEILQKFVFYKRAMDIYDVIANTVGVLIITIVYLVHFIKRSKNS